MVTVSFLVSPRTHPAGGLKPPLRDRGSFASATAREPGLRYAGVG